MTTREASGQNFAQHCQIVRGLPYLDFKFFVNNNPREVSIEGLCGDDWMPLVKKTNVKAYAANKKEFIIDDGLKYAQLRVKTFPDGGVNRLLVFAD